MNWLLVLFCVAVPVWLAGATYHYAGYLPGGRYNQ